MAISQLKDGRWCVYYRKGTVPDDPERTREYFGRGLAGKQAAEERNKELGFGRRKPQEKKRGPSFGEIAAQYQEAKFSRNAPSTKTTLWYKLTNTILPELGHLSVNKLTHHRLDQYVNKRLATQITVWSGPKNHRKKKKLFDADGNPKYVKATTVHRELSDIMAIMSWAEKNRKIAFNPTAGYEKPKRDDATIRPPSPAETRALLKHGPQHLIRAITIAWYTGIRPGAVELLNLKWGDVDWERRCIFVVSAKKGGPPRRVVPLDGNFIAILRSWYKQDDENDSRPLITFNGKPIRDFKTTWKNTKAAAGITRRLRPYDLRHAFVTYLLEGGADLKSVSAMAGHSRTDTTTRIYQHINLDMMRASIAKMPAVISPDNAEYDQESESENAELEGGSEE